MKFKEECLYFQVLQSPIAGIAVLYKDGDMEASCAFEINSLHLKTAIDSVKLNVMAHIHNKEIEMSKLTTKARNALPKKDFALPKERKYPVENKSHAKNAKARASQMVKAGKLSESSKEKIDAKANKVLSQ